MGQIETDGPQPFESFEDLVTAVGRDQDESRKGLAFFVKEVDGSSNIAGVPRPGLKYIKDYIGPVEDCRVLYACAEPLAEQAILDLLEMISKAESAEDFILRINSEVFDEDSDSAELLTRDKGGNYNLDGAASDFFGKMAARRYPLKVAAAIIRDYAVRYPDTVLPILQRELSLDNPGVIQCIVGILAEFEDFSPAALAKVVGISKAALDKSFVLASPEIRGANYSCLIYIGAAGEAVESYLPEFFELATLCDLPEFSEIVSVGDNWNAVLNLIDSASANKDSDFVREKVLDALRHEDERVAMMGILILGQINNPGSEFLDEVARYLESDKDVIRQSAICVLRNFGERASKCIVKLKEIVDENCSISADALLTLSYLIDPEDKAKG